MMEKCWRCEIYYSMNTSIDYHEHLEQVKKCAALDSGLQLLIASLGEEALHHNPYECYRYGRLVLCSHCPSSHQRSDVLVLHLG